MIFIISKPASKKALGNFDTNFPPLDGYLTGLITQDYASCTRQRSVHLQGHGSLRIPSTQRGELMNDCRLFTKFDLKILLQALVASLHQLMGRLEEYFPQPERYIPERWIKGHPLESHSHPFLMMPFGFGTRKCVGRRLAEMEMWQLTVKIMQNFRVEYHYEDIESISRLVNIPDQPLRFRFFDLE